MAQRSEALNFSVLGKLWQLNWSLILLLLIVSGAGLGMLYSAAGGSWEPWASRQAIRLALGMVLMIVIALVSIRVWLKFAYFFYAGALALLASVEVFGAVRMGAQRWIDLKFRPCSCVGALLSFLEFVGCRAPAIFAGAVTDGVGAGGAGDAST
jgi:cell division protein FtsW (lipid II flippase)